jgi:hypothetical protein
MKAHEWRSVICLIGKIGRLHFAHVPRLPRLLGLFLLAGCPCAHAQEPAKPTAAAIVPLTTPDYIERFVHYVHWPAERAGAAWRVCVTSDLAAAQATYAPKRARGRAFIAVVATTPEAARTCQILDLTGIALDEAKRFLDAVATAPVLTIGTGATFCSAGGSVCFSSGNRHAFEINLSSVKRSGLLVNARLLSLGRGRRSGDGGR